MLPANKALALTITPVRLEISGDPGQTVNQQMTLINEFDTPETYYVSYANFEAQGESGTPSFVDATSDLGTWMSAPSSVTLNPKESKKISFSVNIPKNICLEFKTKIVIDILSIRAISKIIPSFI